MKLEEFYEQIKEAVEDRVMAEDADGNFLPFVDYDVRLLTAQDGEVMESAVYDIEVDHDNRVVFIDEGIPVVPAGCWPE